LAIILQQIIRKVALHVFERFHLSTYYVVYVNLCNSVTQLSIQAVAIKKIARLLLHLHSDTTTKCWAIFKE